MSLFTWLATTLHSILDIFHSLIWSASSSSIEYLEFASAKSKTYEEWFACQSELDSLQQRHAWFAKDQDPSYDWKALLGHRAGLQQCREAGDNRGLANQLRGHSTRNMCRILSAPLYQRSRVRTKTLIHSYLLEVSGAIRHLARRESMIASPHIISSQDKRQLFNDVKQALGRTTLVLQGGAAFSLCHLGVVRALHAQSLLPQVITGTATGALIAALVCTTPASELDRRLNGNSIDLSAFERARLRREESHKAAMNISTWYETVLRRYNRFQKNGHFFDIDILQECAKNNLGDVTFGDAYARTGRILNITVALSDVAGMPQLLNYITAPHVLIWSAVVASISTSKVMYGPVSLVCRDKGGSPAEFFASDATSQKVQYGRSVTQEPPLKRIGELFNINHFIISQTRPYMIPFIKLQQPGSSFFSRWSTLFITMWLNDFFYRVNVVAGRWFPPFFKRMILDEAIPGGAHWSKITITPDLHLRDIFHVFDIPTAASIDEWSLRGERSVWPAICELRVRCGVEFDLEVAHESVRRRTPGQADGMPV